MTSAAKTGSLRYTASMAVFSYGRKIRLGMASQAKVAVAGDEHFVLNRTVNFMACGTSIANGLMFPDKRSPLFLVALKTGFVDIDEGG